MSSYGSLDGVTAIVPAVGVITNDSTPNSGQVEDWLTEAYTYINAALGGAGYVVPVARTATGYAILRSLNNLYGAAYALRARGLDSADGKGEMKSEVYLADFFSRLSELVKKDLTSIGIILPTTPGSTGRRGLRSMQLRRVDGYSDAYTGTGPSE